MASSVSHLDLEIEGHPRMKQWLLMAEVKRPVLLVAAYLLFVKLIGPSLMRGRRPFELRRAMVFYNIAMVAVNAYIFLQIATRGWLKNYNWRCEPVDFSDNDDAIAIATACWVFFISKFFEFADTIFFVLRKKDYQVSKLHVFHHAIVPICSWYLKFGPTGWNTFFVMLNSFVHIWMYLYYGMAAIGPGLQKYLWWKKYLTTLQLIQFTLVCLYMANLTLFPLESCHVSTFLFWLNMSNAVIFFVLFVHFYKAAYAGKASSAPRSKHGERIASQQIGRAQHQ